MNNSVCFVIPSFLTTKVGGAELQFYLLSEKFVKEKWNVTIITGIQSNLSIKFNNIFLNEKITYIYYKYTKIKIFQIFSLWNVLRKTKCSFYFQRIHDVSTGVTAIYCKLYMRKMIWFCAHDSDCLYFRSLKDLFKDNSFKELKNIVKKGFRFMNFLIKDLMAFIGKKLSDLRFTQTYFQKKVLWDKLHLDSIVLRNSYNSNYNNFIQKENIILWVANMRSFKNPEIFLMLIAMSNLTNYKFIMIGECKDKKLLKKIIKHEERYPKFRYLGSLSFDLTENWIKKSTILVNTSTTEGFSNTFIQAWLYRTFVISLNCDPDNLIKNKKIGFIGYGNVSDLSRKLEIFAKNYNLRKDFIERAHKFASNHFDIEKNYKKINNYLQKLI